MDDPLRGAMTTVESGTRSTSEYVPEETERVRSQRPSTQFRRTRVSQGRPSRPAFRSAVLGVFFCPCSFASLVHQHGDAEGGNGVLLLAQPKRWRPPDLVRSARWRAERVFYQLRRSITRHRLSLRRPYHCFPPPRAPRFFLSWPGSCLSPRAHFFSAKGVIQLYLTYPIDGRGPRQGDEALFLQHIGTQIVNPATAVRIPDGGSRWLCRSSSPTSYGSSRYFLGAFAYLSSPPHGSRPCANTATPAHRASPRPPLRTESIFLSALRTRKACGRGYIFLISSLISWGSHH